MKEGDPLSKLQKLLLSIYLPVTCLILILQTLTPGAELVNYMKFAAISSLFLFALSIEKKYKEQKILAASLFFVMVGDFFLVLWETVSSLEINVVQFGMFGFTLAYITLITVFQKNFKIGWKEIGVALPIVAIFSAMFLKISPNINGPMYYAVLGFGLILCYTSWTLINTIFKDYYSSASAYRIALAGLLIFVCDIGVGNAQFNSQYSGHFVTWLENIIWAAYIPAWTLIVTVIAEKNLLKDQ